MHKGFRLELGVQEVFLKDLMNDNTAGSGTATGTPNTSVFL